MKNNKLKTEKLIQKRIKAETKVFKAQARLINAQAKATK